MSFIDPEAALIRAGGEAEIYHANSTGTIPPETSKSEIWCDTTSWNEADIPKRPWLAVGYLIRGAVTMVVGSGGVSKSSLMLSWAVHLALGSPFHNMTPNDAFRVMVYNVEDDAAEQLRRLSGVLRAVGKSSNHIAGKVARIGPKQIGTLVTRNDAGIQVDTQAMIELEEQMTLFKPDVVILDPLAELHISEENDNNALRRVIARFRSLAVKHKVAVVILHHTRKGVVTPGDIDAVRGASSIVGAARVVFTVTSMTEADATAFGLPKESRKSYFRLDGGKSNYAGLTDAEWFERVTYTLSNGDTTVAVTPWWPPADVCSIETMASIEAGIRRGSQHGPWSPQIGNTDRSVKHLMVETGITTLAGQKNALASLLKAGFQSLKYKDKEARKTVNGLRSPDGLPSNYQWIAADAG